MQRFRNFSLSFNSLAIVLPILAILTYGIHIAWMGFYWDDWPWIWFSQVMGPAGMLKIDVEHRPITGVVLWVGSILAGENPVGWQIYNLLWRVLGAAALGWALKQLWPQRDQQVAWVALLFLIYPGFNQQFISVNNSRHIFPLIPLFLSIGLMVKASQDQQHERALTGTAVLLSILTMFTTEYYYGLELVRPLVLWLACGDSWENYPARIKAAFKGWLPYLIPLMLVFIWRYLVSKSVNYGITLLNDLKSSPADGVMAYIRRGAIDIFDAALNAWGQVFQMPDPLLFGQRTQLYILGIAALTGLGIMGYLYFLKSGHRDRNWGRQAVFLGVTAISVAPIPFWVTRLDPRLAFPGDRLNLPMILGACLLLAGLLDLALKWKGLKIALLAFLIGLSVGHHTTNALGYRRDWQHQAQIFEQLTWRIPGLQPGAILLANELPSQYSTDNSLVAPLNWTYAPDFSTGQLPFFIYYKDLRFESGKRQVDPHATYTELYRFYPFQSAADQVVILYQQQPGCLRVLDAARHQQDPSLPEEIKALLPYSNLEQIVTSGNAQLPPPFQKDNLDGQTDTWCYYFERADLARQSGDWTQVAKLGDLAFETSFPDSAIKHVPEYVVFIEGYAQNNAWVQAQDLTLDAYKIDPLMQGMLCDAWARIDMETPHSDEKLAVVGKVNEKLGCGP